MRLGKRHFFGPAVLPLGRQEDHFLKPITVLCLISIVAGIAMGVSSACAAKARLLYVNSYHSGYRWSDDIEKGLLKALDINRTADGTLDESRSGVEIRIYRMDTKLNPSENFKRRAALAAKQIIDTWHPDVVVTSDDNAAKYLIVPYYKNAAIPFVFCGLNRDASLYGFPVANVTGMIEVAPLRETVAILSTYARGARIGYIGADEFTNRKTLPHQERALGRPYTDGALVATFDDWKREYLRLQDAVDILIWLNPIGIAGWDPPAAIRFIHANTTIPSGCSGDTTIPYVLLAQTGIAEEQGWWAGKTALDILAGRDPADIPITRNKESRIYLNMRLAARLGIKFPVELIERATFLEELPERD